MQDKKEQSKQRELKIVNTTKDFREEVFPTRQKGVHVILEATYDNEVVCYLCMDIPPGPITVLHIYIPPDQRSYKKIMKLRDLFYELLHPWCKNHGFAQILFSCAGNDQKTTDLAIAMGFKPENINMAMMPVQ